MRPRGALLVLPAILAGLPEAEAQIYTRKNSNGVVEATNIPDAPNYLLAYPGKGTLIHSRGFRRSYNGQFDHHIEAAARHHMVSVDLVKAVISVESEFDALAVSSKGAQGLMQLMPHTARRFGVGDSFDARQNIFGGTQYLRFLLDLFQGNVDLALAAYNAGENAVHRYHGIPPYRETRQYVAKVQGLLGGGYEQVRAVFFAAPPKPPAPKTAKPVKLQPARPRIYYKWRDDRGLHVAETPPGEGVVYSMIRALD
ncbi:MAG TPA: lytic transglycosylase domain-containing protein [Vicinamibacteria bacterium]